MFKRLMARFGVAQNSSLSNPDQWLLDAYSAASASGVRVNALTAMGVPTVFACVNAVSRSIASLPLKLYRRMPDGSKEEATEHPLYPILHSAPNEEMPGVVFRRAMQANATLRNAAYALIVRDGMGDVAELHPINNWDIKPARDETTKKLYYLLKGERVEPYYILCIPGLTFNGITGFDPIGVARDAIGLAASLQEHAARYFPNASSPSLAIEIPDRKTPEQMAQFAAEFDKHNTGNANAHRRMFLWGGVKLAARSQGGTNREGQFHESKVYQDMGICQIFGVPPIKAGITADAHYNNVEQEMQAFVTDVLLPWCVTWEQCINQRCLTPRDRKRYFAEFSLDGLLRADVVARATANQINIQNGLLCRNEIRKMDNRNPVPGGDKFTISQNVRMLDEEGNPVPDAPAGEEPNPVS